GVSRGGSRTVARWGEAGLHALLLRGADAARDRRVARRHRVSLLAVAHEGGPTPEGPSRRCSGSRAGRVAPFQGAPSLLPAASVVRRSTRVGDGFVPEPWRSFNSGRLVKID